MMQKKGRNPVETVEAVGTDSELRTCAGAARRRAGAARAVDGAVCQVSGGRAGVDFAPARPQQGAGDPS